MMTKEELIAKLTAIAAGVLDIESGHIEADKLLLEYIDDREVNEAFDSVEKWYA